MTESEVRETIRRICAQIDARIGAGVRKIAVPIAVGTGLSLSPGCETGPGAMPDGYAADAYGVDVSPDFDPGKYDPGDVAVYDLPWNFDQGGYDPGKDYSDEVPVYDAPSSYDTGGTEPGPGTGSGDETADDETDAQASDTAPAPDGEP
jgi:hypothetical protein